MITITNKTLINSQGALAALLGLKMPAPAAFGLTRATRAVDSVVEDYEKIRMELVRRHAVLDDAGEPKPVEGDAKRIQIADMAAFQKDFEELQQTEVTLPIDPLPVTSLGDVQVEPAVLLKLDWLIN